jgi:hypothetical protein
MEADGRALGRDRAVALPNRTYSAAEMIAAAKRAADDKDLALGVIYPWPDPAVEAIVGSWPLRMDDSRALALGLPADAGLERLIEDYLADFGRDFPVG